MTNIDKIEKAYNNGKFFHDIPIDFELDIRNSDSVNLEKINYSLLNIKNVIKYWSLNFKYENPIIIISSDENGYDFLSDHLNALNFQDAIPTKEKWEQYAKHSSFGSGGYTIVNDKKYLLYWQVIGSSNPFTGTGNIKTGPHLFTHAVQGAMTDNTNVIATDFPGWFIEGQSDFAALMCISNTFKQYLFHRANFFKYGYVPNSNNMSSDDIRSQMKKMKITDWENLYINSPSKFAGIPLIHEYYIGLLAYEKLMEILTHEEIMKLYDDFTQGKDFNELIRLYTGKNIYDFYKELSIDLIDLAKTIESNDGV